jgi:AraC-like DNA-binding protein
MTRVNNDAIQAFLKMFKNNELLFMALDNFPIPVQIFAADGTIVFLNQAFIKLHGIPETGFMLGKYNLLSDPVCNDQLGYKKDIHKAFSGEQVFIQDFRPPIQNLVDHGIIKEKPYESAIMDVFLTPIHNKNRLNLVICVFIVKNIYQGNQEVAKAKECLALNWCGNYDPQKTAETVKISVAQLYSLFKQHAGMTPGDYHKQCKVEHLKEKLMDKNLTVKEAFQACGENNKGWIARVFKEITGLTPTQFRQKL